MANLLRSHSKGALQGLCKNIGNSVILFIINYNLLSSIPLNVQFLLKVKRCFTCGEEAGFASPTLYPCINPHSDQSTVLLLCSWGWLSKLAGRTNLGKSLPSLKCQRPFPLLKPQPQPWIGNISGKFNIRAAINISRWCLFLSKEQGQLVATFQVCGGGCRLFF